MLSIVENIREIANYCMNEGKSEQEANRIIKIYASGLSNNLSSGKCEKCTWIPLDKSSIHFCPNCGYVLPF